MKLNFDIDNNILIVSINGEIDHHTAEEIRNDIERNFYNANVKNMIFDFSSVTFMDSSGIGMIIGRYKMMRLIGGSLEITNISATVRRILEMSGINKIIPMEDKKEVG